MSARSATLPLEYLRELGAVPLSSQTVDGPLERLLADFGRYLLDERGLTEGTVEHYVPAARLFLTSRAGAELGGLERLSGADVSLFLAAECPKRGVAAARTLTSGLRSLLGWLYLTGRIADRLVWAVPAVADLRDRSLPRGLDAATVKRLLASCDRRRTVGRRDYAVLLLLSRLGLRAGEVAAITLDDIDWRVGELLVRNRKGRRVERLPVPTAVSYCTSVDPVFGFCVDVARVRDALAAVLIDVWPELDPQPSAGAAPGLQPAVADPVVDGAL